MSGLSVASGAAGGTHKSKVEWKAGGRLFANQLVSVL